MIPLLLIAGVLGLVVVVKKKSEAADQGRLPPRAEPKNAPDDLHETRLSSILDGLDDGQTHRILAGRVEKNKATINADIDRRWYADVGDKREPMFEKQDIAAIKTVSGITRPKYEMLAVNPVMASNTYNSGLLLPDAPRTLRDSAPLVLQTNKPRRIE